MKKEESQFISLAEAAKMTNYSQDYISLLCRQGKLKAEKLGRNWVTKKEWVYNYVDNTSGKGESVVPVKVKAAGETGKKAEKGSGKFFGQSVLEIAFFCFACIIWLVNVYLLVGYVQKGNGGAGLAPSDASALNAIVSTSLNADNPLGAASAPTVAETCSGAQPLDSLTAFDIETDAAVIEQRKNEIKAKFTGDIEMEIHKNFAVLNYASNPERKFLYTFGS
jgi:hypothetical protein